jgi:hypothetical protein
MDNRPINPALVEKLTRILEQAKTGELTGFSAVTFKENGGVDQWGILTREQDARRVVAELETLTQQHREMTT